MLKKISSTAFVGMLVLTAYAPTDASTDEDTGAAAISEAMVASSIMMDSSAGMMASSDAMMDSSATMQTSSAGALTSESAMTGPQVITVTAKNWEFSPNVIRVKKGQKLTLRVTGQEGVHGLMVKDLGINQTIDLGKTVEIEIPTDQEGTFAFRCSVPCGPGHMDMIGQIIIEAA